MHLRCLNIELFFLSFRFKIKLFLTIFYVEEMQYAMLIIHIYVSTLIRSIHVFHCLVGVLIAGFIE